MSRPSWRLGTQKATKRPPRSNLVRNSVAVAAVRASRPGAAEGRPLNSARRRLVRALGLALPEDPHAPS